MYGFNDLVGHPLAGDVDYEPQPVEPPEVGEGLADAS